MKKIVSNMLIVSTQLIVGGLFLFMLFSDSNEDNRVVVVENNNLDKMADAVSELFVVDHAVAEDTDKQKEEELIAAEQKKAEEEARAKAEAEAKALAEAQAKAAAEAEAARIAQEEAARKAAEEAARNQVVVDATGYISKPAAGFNVTTGNRTYVLDDNQFGILASVVSCEANRSSKDDILAVMSVILNRADRNGIDPVSVVAAPYQFSCYKEGNSIVPSDTVAGVMRDALNGVRNNNYYSFNAWYTNRSENYIVERGNRYF